MSYLAIDVGTTRTKVGWYDESIRPRAVESEPTPGIGGGVFDAAAILSVLEKLIPRVLRRPSPQGAPIGRVSAIGITSFLSHIALDEEGACVPPLMTWSFQPGAEALGVCVAACDDGGWELERPVSMELLAPRLVALARSDPSFPERVVRIVCLKDVIRTMLSADSVTMYTDWSFRDYSLIRDRNDEVITPIVELLKREGYEEPESLLPPALSAHTPAGTLSPRFAHRFGLTPGIPLTTGATDGTTAMYGGGVLSDGGIVTLFGTTDVVMRAVPRLSDEYFVAPARGLSRNAAVHRDFDLLGGSTSSSGGAAMWMQDILRDGEGWYAVPAGAEGVRVAPGFDGERAPWNKARCRGRVDGLTSAHRGSHIFRALMEANIFRVRSLVEGLLQLYPGGRNTVLLGGGGNRTLHLDALRSAILPWPLRWRRDQELSLAGAAIFAAACLAADQEERDAVLLACCRRVGGDVLYSETPDDLSTQRREYERLYEEWVEWISEVYGVQR